ncbi:MAG: malectin domain-containing carbohydrate-binding protein, partial [Bacteroidota bacterium]
PENYSEIATGTGVEVHPDGKQSELFFAETQIDQQTSRTLYLRSLGQIYPDFNDPDIQIYGVEVIGANPDEFEITEPLDNLLSPGESTSLNIHFRPYRKGLKNATLLVHYNSANSPRRVPLYGTASSDCINSALIKRIKTATPNNSAMNIGSQTWESDLSYRVNTGDFNAAQTSDQITEIGLTDQDPLYRSFAVANQDGKAIYYQIPLNNGSYSVRLHFAERYFQEANERVFHVQLENNYAEVGLDVFAEVGFNNALVKDYTVDINDGVLNIDLLPVQSRPYIMGMEIYSFTNPNGLSLDVVNQNPADCGFENGSIEVALNGTPLPALFKLGKYGTYQSNGLFADLAPGSYTIYAKEEGLEACELSQNISVGSTCQFKATDEGNETNNTDLSASTSEGNDSFISPYPNPFKDEIQLNASDDLVNQKNIILKVYTLQEKLIFNTSGDLNSLAEALQKQAPQIKPGVYIFKFFTESNTYESKVVKQ